MSIHHTTWVRRKTFGKAMNECLKHHQEFRLRYQHTSQLTITQRSNLRIIAAKTWRRYVGGPSKQRALHEQPCQRLLAQGRSRAHTIWLQNRKPQCSISSGCTNKVKSLVLKARSDPQANEVISGDCGEIMNHTCFPSTNENHPNQDITSPMTDTRHQGEASPKQGLAQE